MHRYETRLHAVATRLRCCARHGTPLICSVCTYECRGSEDECQELVPLADRVAPSIDRIRTSDQRRECGEGLLCPQCYEAQACTIIVPDDLMTEDETTRYLELLQHIQSRAYHRT
jgi:hypothetical protein